VNVWGTRQRTQASTASQKTTGELSTNNQHCDYCGRWFVNLSNHRKCGGRSRTASHTEVRDALQPGDNLTSRTHSHSGTITKYALQQKALQPKNKILQVCDVFITVTEIH